MLRFNRNLLTMAYLGDRNHFLKTAVFGNSVEKIALNSPINSEEPAKTDIL